MVYYIYKIIDPRDNKPFYVGQTANTKERFSQHHSDKKGEKGKRIQEIRKAGFRVLFVVIEKCTYNDCTKRERYWIDLLISQGNNLVNVITWGKNNQLSYDVKYECEI